MIRIDAGTDIAILGAWDSSRNRSPLTDVERRDWTNTLKKDARDGHLFFINTGADCGGFIDVYVDEKIPEGIEKQNKKIDRDFLLSAPSGEIIVGGVEDYRNRVPKITGPASVLKVPPGDYLLTCYLGKNDEESDEEKSESALEKKVGASEIRYFDRLNRLGCATGIACAAIIFIAVTLLWGWKIALPSALIVFVSYFHLRERLMKRNKRYQSLNNIIPLYRIAHQGPLFIFAFKNTPRAMEGKEGGYVEL